MNQIVMTNGLMLTLSHQQAGELMKTMVDATTETGKLYYHIP
jgi:hypothetical protein